MLVCFNLGLYLLDVKEENIDVITKSGRFLFVYFDKYVLLSFRNDSIILWYNELKQAAPACFLKGNGHYTMQTSSTRIMYLLLSRMKF